MRNSLMHLEILMQNRKFADRGRGYRHDKVPDMPKDSRLRS